MIILTISTETEILFKVLELIVSFLGFAAIVGSIWLGLKNHRKTISNQWNQEFYKQKIEIYLRTSEVAAQIAVQSKSDDSNQELGKLISEFKTMYWGAMAIMEDSDVVNAMVNFRKALDEGVKGNDLLNMSLYLSHILRNDSRKEYRLEAESTSCVGPNETLLTKMKAILDKNDTSHKRVDG